MISTIIIGFIIGILAKFLYPGGQRLGIIMTTLLGIGGLCLTKQTKAASTDSGWWAAFFVLAWCSNCI